jgi:hypothetical protein
MLVDGKSETEQRGNLEVGCLALAGVGNVLGAQLGDVSTDIRMR